MKLSKLKRAIACFLSAAMLIMSVPLVGVTAFAATLDEDTMISLDANGGHFSDFEDSKDVSLTAEGKLTPGSLSETPTYEGNVFDGWYAYSESRGEEILIDEDFVFTDDNVNAGVAVSVNAHWKTIANNIRVINRFGDIFCGYNAATLTAEDMKNYSTEFRMNSENSVKPKLISADWYCVEKGAAFDPSGLTNCNESIVDSTKDYYLYMTMDVSDIGYTFQSAPTFLDFYGKTMDVNIHSFDDTILKFSWKSTPYEVITNVYDIKVTPDVTSPSYVLESGEVPSDFTVTAKAKTKCGKVLELPSENDETLALWYNADDLNGRPAEEIVDGQSYVPAFAVVIMPVDGVKYLPACEYLGLTDMEDMKSDTDGFTCDAEVSLDLPGVFFRASAITAGEASAPSVTFNADGGTLPSGTVNPAETVDGKLAELPTPTRDFYVFTGWFDADGSKITTDTVFTSDATVTAHWVRDTNCVKALNIMESTYAALNGSNLVSENPFIPQVNYNYSFKNWGDNNPAQAESIGEPEFYYVAKGAEFSTETATKCDGNTIVDGSKYDYYFVQTLTTNEELKFYDAPELVCPGLTAKVESYTENSVTISCKAMAVDVITEVTGLTIVPDVNADDFELSADTPSELKVTAKVKTLTGKEMTVPAGFSFMDSGDHEAETLEPGDEYTLAVYLYCDEDSAFIFADEDMLGYGTDISSEITAAGYNAEMSFYAGMMLKGSKTYSYGNTENKAEKAAADISAALAEFKPTNDTAKSDVQAIVDTNKGDATATVTAFELTPATTDNNGSLKVVITVSDGVNTETVEKTYVIEKLPENKAEKAAADISAALAEFKPTNDTAKSDVQAIVDTNKGDTTATVTTFEITPATTDNNGSLKVVITVSDGVNTETIEKTYVIEKLPENKAEKAAADISTALAEFKPTNDTAKSDVQAIVDTNKGDATATVTTFELTPATTDNNGSLKVVITVSDGVNTEIVEKTYAIEKLPASSDEGDIIVDTDANVGGAGVNGSEVKEAVEITPEEKNLIDSGENLYIILNVQNADSTVSAEDKTLTESVLSDGMTAEMFLDITLFKKIGTLQTAVTATNAPITITFEMPESLISTNKNVTREYFVIRVHNGKAEILDCAFDPATGKASFKTDKFSSYAIAYKDKKNSYVIPSHAISRPSHSRPASSNTDHTSFTYKLNVTAEAQEGSVKLSWDKVQNADSYIVYELKNGKYTEVKTTKETSVTFNDLTSGSTYKYMVKYTVNGVTCSDDYAGAASAEVYCKLSVTAEAQKRSITLSWNEIQNADSYTVYQFKDGKYSAERTTNGTSVTFSKLKNNSTYKYIVRYTVNGKKCSDEYAGEVSVNLYYKPAVTANSGKNSVTLRWKAVPDAEKYTVYKYVNGKAVKLAGTSKHAVTIKGLKSDKEYQYVVNAYVGGKWTTMRTSDVVTIRTKA